MDADWDEVTRIAFPAPGSNDFPRPATTLAFDTIAELLWAGNDRGRVVSFYGRELQRYTAFKIHPSGEGPVRQFLFHDKGIIALGTRSVHMAMRRGPALWNIRHDDMRDLQCMSFTSKGASEIVVAGFQNTMFVIDVIKGEIVKQVPTEHYYTIMKKSKYICAATRNGSVHLLDPITFHIVRSWQAHASYINDMDAQNDFIVTCGGSLKQQAAQAYMLDPYVNVFDLKNMVSMKPMPFPPLAAHVRLHPRMLTTSIVASQHGQMHVVDIMNPNTSNVRYANVMSVISLFEMAPSGEALAMADNECNIHLWGSPSKLHFTDMAIPIDMPKAEESAPMLDWSPDTPLSSVGMPYYREQLFSAWPADIISDVGGPPVQLDPALLSTLKQTEWGLYGRNTRGLRRNQVEDTRVNMKPSLQPPKFLSEKARESALSYTTTPELKPEQLAEPPPSNELDSLKPEAPAMYRNLEIKYSKFGVDDFDFGYYNKTQYAGLENHIPNSYANSLLQLMHYTPLLRNLALQHAATACVSDLCLLCELGFVFDMLEKAEGSTCQATNLFKALGATPQAAPLGLLEEETHVPSLSTMSQGLSRFLFDRINHEYRSIPPVSTRLEQMLFQLPQPPTADDLASRVLATSAVVTIKCMNCRSETTRPGTAQVNDLMYPPPKGAVRGGRAHKTIFSQALKMGVERETASKGWCSRCQRYQNLQMRKTIHSIPAVLAVNTAISTQEHRRLWASPGWLPEEIGVIVDQGQFFCFEGEDLKLHLQRGIHNITVYSLVGMVVNIESSAPQKTHLVGIINVAHAEPTPPAESKWHLFNDFSVRPISATEALTFNATWKMPSILLYQVKAANNTTNTDWKTQLDTSILYQDRTPHSDAKTYRVLEQPGERPGPDTIIGLDTEFVSLKQPEIQMNSDGERETIRPMSHALARVSVVRGQGEHEGEAFIDDYIAIREPVVDYLTLYSGITAGDLDPRTTRHNLVTLKIAYKKLWVLLNLGCKFLGHGLRQDFRVINIQVPQAQVIDTIQVFYLKSRLRKLSLAFLAWYLLKEDIQLETHDSIEDARTALKLYRKYLEFDDAGILEAMLDDIYKAGRATNFKPPRKEDQVIQRTDTPPVTAPAEGTGGVEGNGGGDGGEAVPPEPVTPAGKAVGLAGAGGTPFGVVNVFTPGKGSPLPK
ncbi:ubiquitin carboxyl-terminal hydrolase-domain-containing protein [Dichotomopilus funicola]|uniref:PAN2-PAN3 deadenylation complex catalytic subunit PAN2 n=1 Tax=Dichotomopilus funicola TaxID=1934379 RepID=A0AAN6V6F2_9PEZI|nr:ubiquitin carboxyl-terminal hydrolase-domain-containing protein [Dichotomopilus funicola]